MIADKCLVVLSGGQDSTTALFWAKREFAEVHCITFNYGQRHQIEIDSAIKVSELAGVKDENHSFVDISPRSYTNNSGAYERILESSSPLVANTQLETYQNYDEMQKIIGDRVELTFVPMRNALFLVIAANRAAVKGIKHIITGVCEADGANYPDCRRDFIDAAAMMITLALGDDMFIHTPLIDLKKSESVKLALTLPGCYHALAYSHTAYDGKYPPTGKDHASVLRAHGFEEAGVPDPLVVRAMFEKKMKPPQQHTYDQWRYLASPEFIANYEISSDEIDVTIKNIETQLRK